MRSTLIKELKILFRDPVGFLLLLIMPGILIIVMAVTQDSSYKDLQDTEFEVSIANLDKGTVGAEIMQAIDASDKFKVNKLTDTSNLKHDVNNGKIKIGVIIPENAGNAIVNISNKVVNSVSSASGMPAVMTNNEQLDSVKIDLFFDPILKPALKNGFRFALTQYITQAKMNALMARLNKVSGSNAAMDTALINQMTKVLDLNEGHTATNSKAHIAINSVQHNVPSWAIFAMFLIVVPISGNMLREREEGSVTRLKLIPDALVKSTLGTLMFYVLVCTIQFYLLIMIGIYLMPMFGLPKLSMGLNPLHSLPLVIATGFAATAYGYFIGTVFKTANQAMPVGAVSVVILAALGGIWVPLEILPKMMTTVANFTPLYWCFNGINNLFVRGEGFNSTLPSIGLLILFGAALTYISVILAKRKSND